MRAPALFCVVLAIHALALGGFSLLQGCATRQPFVNKGNPEASGNQNQTDMPPPLVSDAEGPGGRSVIPDRPEITPATPRVTPRPTPRAPNTDGATQYTVKKGESLSRIAYNHGISYRDLADYNSLSNPNAIRVNQKILIPPYAKKRTPAPAVTRTPSAPVATPATPSAPEAAPTVPGGMYVVQSGDSLWVIARKHNTTVAKLKAANGLTSDVVRIGKELKIPVAGASTIVAPEGPEEMPVLPTAPTSDPTPATPVTPTPDISEGTSTDPEDDPVDGRAFRITVEEGETLESIASSYIVSVDEIRKLNKLGADAEVKAGDDLLIPPSVF